MQLHLLLLEYLASRKSPEYHSDAPFRRKLQLMKKTESEIHEILIEFIDEWEKELMDLQMIKTSNFNIIVGAIAGVTLCLFTWIAASGYFGKYKFLIISYGLIAGSFGMVINGFSMKKRVKLRQQRREIKWRNW